jgi:cell division septation protein DedD
VVATVVIVFLVWWFNEERTGGGGSEPPQTTSSSAVSDARPGGRPADAGTGTQPVAVVDSTVAVAVAPDTTPAQPDPEPTGEAGVVSSDNILVMDDLENNWGGQYLIHISSFRDSEKARTEVGHLTSRGFSVFIVYLNLGAKGSWYRVYAGPITTRVDARNTKKLLDDTPGVRFTRITQIAN